MRVSGTKEKEMVTVSSQNVTVTTLKVTGCVICAKDKAVIFSIRKTNYSSASG